MYCAHSYCRISMHSGKLSVTVNLNTAVQIDREKHHTVQRVKLLAY